MYLLPLGACVGEDKEAAEAAGYHLPLDCEVPRLNFLGFSFLLFFGFIHRNVMFTTCCCASKAGSRRGLSTPDTYLSHITRSQMPALPPSPHLKTTSYFRTFAFFALSPPLTTIYEYSLVWRHPLIVYFYWFVSFWPCLLLRGFRLRALEFRIVRFFSVLYFRYALDSLVRNELM